MDAGGIFDPDFLRPFEARPSHSLWPEFVAVAAGLKPVLRTYDIRAGLLPRLARACREQGLCAVASDFRTAGRAVYVYIARSPAAAQEAARIEGESLRRDRGDRKVFRRFAELMGYPRCCTDAFFDYSCRHDAGESHLIEYSILRRTRGRLSPYLNNLIRDGRYLISHYPCSYACRPSIAYARKVLSALPGPAGAQFQDLLSSPVLKFPGQGIYLRLLNGRAGAGGLAAYASCDGEVGLVRRFSRGNGLQAGRASIRIFKDGRLVDTYRKSGVRDGVLFDFARS